jgi:sialate O-acetylesterase
MLLLVTALLLAKGSSAAIRFSNVFGSHQVLQRGAPVAVWGWGGSGAVDGAWGGEKQSTTADAAGFWRLTFAPRATSFTPSSVTVSSNGATATLDDVLVGDVVFCSGQSNMELSTNDVGGCRRPPAQSPATPTNTHPNPQPQTPHQPQPNS